MKEGKGTPLGQKGFLKSATEEKKPTRKSKGKS
jgi:hypothetical protein